MRLAHFSDVHITLSPVIEGPMGLIGEPKRWVGTANWLLGGRRQHFSGVEERLAALLEDVDAQNVEHALCTGDLTAVAYDAEMQRAAEIFGARLEHPERYTVLPGNHDRYVRSNDRVFERYFSAVADAGRGYPYMKPIAPGVTLIAIDVTRPTSLFDSSGEVGATQMEALRRLLHDPALEREMVIVALHYGLLRSEGERDRPSHGIRDDLALIAALDDPAARVDLVLHGHIHKAYRVKTERRTIACAGSATDLHVACGYDVYELDPAARVFTASRRVWDPASRRYVAAPS